MFTKIYNNLFSRSKVFLTEVNVIMRDDAEQLMDITKEIENQQMLNHITDIKLGVKNNKFKAEIKSIKILHKEVSQFLYEYQKVIPFDKTSYTKGLQPDRKYWCKSGFRIKKERDFYNDIIYKKWTSEAELFLNGKKELTDKLLGIYSELDCYYQCPDTYNKKDWKYTMNNDGIIEHKSEKVTLEQVLCGLVMYQEGIYNDNRNTREWGLYDSLFYNIVMLQVLTKIVSEIEAMYVEPKTELESEIELEVE